MKLNRRRLGKTGLEITTVGFGAWAIGGGGSEEIVGRALRDAGSGPVTGAWKGAA